MTKTKLLALGTLVLLCAGAGWFWQSQQLQRMRAENARLAETAAEADSLREEVTRLRQQQVDPAELERLRQSQSELLRLRGEASRLRQQLKEAELARRNAALAKESPPASAPAEEAVSPVVTYSATLRTKLASGQTLITGGWATAEGKRTLVLVEPVVGGPDAPGIVTIQTRFAEMPEDVFSKSGFDWMKTGTKESSAQSILNADQAAHLVATLEGSQGVDVLSAPKVQTLDGHRARVESTTVRTLGPGETHALEPVVNFVPTISADGRSVDLTVIAQLKLQSAKAR
jgi:uncharacterized protein YdcH (DUF465 family)